MAAHAEFCARRTDEGEILDDVRSLRQRLADLDVTVLDLPELFARLRVESDEVAVELGLDDESGNLAVTRPVGQTAVHEIAASDRASGRILLRLVLPKDVAGVVQVECERVVRERRVHVHDAVDDERRAFMAVQETGRERPGSAQLLHVLGVDLLVGAVVLRAVVLARHHPVFIALRQLVELVVCSGRRNKRDA